MQNNQISIDDIIKDVINIEKIIEVKKDEIQQLELTKKSHIRNLESYYVQVEKQKLSEINKKKTDEAKKDEGKAE